MTEPPSLLDLGSHCAECGQLSFLPFTCPDCSRAFCGDHRLSHATCDGAGSTAKKTTPTPNVDDASSSSIVCPLCTKRVEVRPNESPDQAHARHSRLQGECTPRPRCAASGCKSRPVATARVTCSRCGALLCMAHRLPEDHACEGLAREQRQQQKQKQKQKQKHHQEFGRGAREALAEAGASARRAFAAAATTAATAASSSRRPSAPADPGNTVSGTAAVRARALALPELCPVCPRAQDVRFATVTELIAHCERAHGANGGGVGARRRVGGNARGGGGGGDGKCVIC